MGTTTTADDSTDTERGIAFDRAGDWLLGALLGVAGVLFGLGGAALYSGVSRPDVAEAIRESEFRSDVLTEAEAVDGLVAVAQWSGAGLAVAGGLLVVLAVAVVVAHGRARRAGRGTPAWVLGVAGASVTAVLAFVPFSAALGGAAAGYLDTAPDTSGVGAGALAGVVASLPLLVSALVASVGLVVTASAAAVLVVPVVGVAVFLSVLYVTVPSAIGGYVGHWLAAR